MVVHKFKIGQRVTFRASRDDFAATYAVTALLPRMAGEFKYRIRRLDASIDLVVSESELRENKER